LEEGESFPSPSLSIHRRAIGPAGKIRTGSQGSVQRTSARWVARTTRSARCTAHSRLRGYAVPNGFAITAEG